MIARIVSALLIILHLVTALYWDAPEPITTPLRIEAVGVRVGNVYVLDDVASINLAPPQRACWSVTATDAAGQRATWAARGDCGRVLWLPLVAHEHLFAPKNRPRLV